MVTPSGTTIGRNDSVCGQTGMISVPGTFGCTIEAPADAAYAVLPVGVDIIRPDVQTRMLFQSKADCVCV